MPPGLDMYRTYHTYVSCAGPHTLHNWSWYYSTGTTERHAYSYCMAIWFTRYCSSVSAHHYIVVICLVYLCYVCTTMYGTSLWAMTLQKPIFWRVIAHGRYEQCFARLLCLGLYLHVCVFIFWRVIAHSRYEQYFARLLCIGLYLHVCVFLTLNRPLYPSTYEQFISYNIRESCYSYYRCERAQTLPAAGTWSFDFVLPLIVGLINRWCDVLKIWSPLFVYFTMWKLWISAVLQ